MKKAFFAIALLAAAFFLAESTRLGKRWNIGFADSERKGISFTVFSHKILITLSFFPTDSMINMTDEKAILRHQMHQEMKHRHGIRTAGHSDDNFPFIWNHRILRHCLYDFFCQFILLHHGRPHAK